MLEGENKKLTVRCQPLIEIEPGRQIDHHLQVGIGQFALQHALLQIQLRIGGGLIAIALFAARFAVKRGTENHRVSTSTPIL